MNLIEFLNRINRRYAWSLLGFVLAGMFGTITVYSEFIRDRRPDLRFEIISDASVLDVHEQLSDLEILYDGLDIQKSKKSLRILVVRVINKGPEDILKGHYDESAPLGFRLTGGILLRVEVSAASSSYLKTTLSVRTPNSSNALFDPVILEAGEWFIVKSLILHPESDHPTLEPIGKVAGVRSIRIDDAAQAREESSFLSQTFTGGVWIQASRLVAYFLGFIALLVAVIAPKVMISGAFSKRRRRGQVEHFKDQSKLEVTDQDEYIFERYVQNDILSVRTLERGAANEDYLNNMIMSRVGHWTRFGISMRDMKRAGFVEKEGARWRVNGHATETLKKFLQFLERTRAA